jgi:hypothetical protein
MLDFAFLLDKTRAAQASVSRLEAAISLRPGDAALHINLAAQRRLADRFQQRFFEAAKLSHVDICKYRLVPNTTEDYSLTAVTRSLEKFRELFTMTYGAIQYKAQRIRQALLKESALQFGYTYSGSLGIVLTAQGSRDLFITKFGPAIDAVHELFGISSQDEVIDFARKLEPTVVKRAYDWSLRIIRVIFRLINVGAIGRAL